jgi:hypothetical protein
MALSRWGAVAAAVPGARLAAEGDCGKAGHTFRQKRDHAFHDQDRIMAGKPTGHLKECAVEG